jgi:hypothetical protein
VGDEGAEVVVGCGSGRLFCVFVVGGGVAHGEGGC